MCVDIWLVMCLFGVWGVGGGLGWLSVVVGDGDACGVVCVVEEADGCGCGECFDGGFEVFDAL